MLNKLKEELKIKVPSKAEINYINLGAFAKCDVKEKINNPIKYIHVSSFVSDLLKEIERLKKG